MRLRQAVPGQGENLIYDFPLARATYVGREQEADAQDLCGQADHLRRSLAKLILELRDEGPVVLIGRGDERSMNLVHDVRAPNGRTFEKQGAVTQKAVRAERLRDSVDFARVVSCRVVSCSV